jgi:distribution and morphology protein 31
MPRSELAKFERKSLLQEEDEYKLKTSAGSPITTGALESIARLTNSSEPDSFDDSPLAGVHFDEDEANNEALRKWMWFDLTIESIQVTLNLVRWLDGKGLVQDADVQGVRGVIGKIFVPNPVATYILGLMKFLSFRSSACEMGSQSSIRSCCSTPKVYTW